MGSYNEFLPELKVLGEQYYTAILAKFSDIIQQFN